jgi:hypothetical protein
MSIGNIASVDVKWGVNGCWGPHHRPRGDGGDPPDPRLLIPEYLRYSIVLTPPPPAGSAPTRPPRGWRPGPRIEVWWAKQDSNLWPPACKAGALTS